MGTPLPSSLTVIFDGYCGMCTRTIAWLMDHDRAGRLEPVPCQNVDGVVRFGLSHSQCEASIWTLTDDGDLASGGQAMMLILAVLWQQPWIATIGRLPGVRQALDFGYGLVARNRRRFPGMTPWCESHPDACFPSNGASCSL